MGWRLTCHLDKTGATTRTGDSRSGDTSQGESRSHTLGKLYGTIHCMYLCVSDVHPYLSIHEANNHQ